MPFLAIYLCHFRTREQGRQSKMNDSIDEMHEMTCFVKNNLFHIGFQSLRHSSNRVSRSTVLSSLDVSIFNFSHKSSFLSCHSSCKVCHVKLFFSVAICIWTRSWACSRCAAWWRWATTSFTWGWWRWSV
jgi:hypothetical protein